MIQFSERIIGFFFWSSFSRRRIPSSVGRLRILQDRLLTWRRLRPGRAFICNVWAAVWVVCPSRRTGDTCATPCGRISASPRWSAARRAMDARPPPSTRRCSRSSDPIFSTRSRACGTPRPFPLRSPSRWCPWRRLLSSRSRRTPSSRHSPSRMAPSISPLTNTISAYAYLLLLLMSFKICCSLYYIDFDYCLIPFNRLMQAA